MFPVARGVWRRFSLRQQSAGEICAFLHSLTSDVRRTIARGGDAVAGQLPTGHLVCIPAASCVIIPEASDPRIERVLRVACSLIGPTYR